MGAELLIPILSGLCCLSAFVVMVVAAVLVLRHFKSKNAGGSDGGGGPELAAPSSAGPAAGSPFPASASAELGGGSPATAGYPSAASGRVALDADVEDFDEDGPTTLVDTAARRPGSVSSMAPTDQIPVPGARGGGPRSAVSPGFGGVPAPDEPPPLPRSHAAGRPPSARRLHLDPGLGPDTSHLQPGATIIPPDDWHDDYIDDDEADETMLMARPPLPPKK